MVERLKRLYASGRLDDNGIASAVEKKLISADDYRLITGKDYKAKADEETAE